MSSTAAIAGQVIAVATITMPRGAATAVALDQAPIATVGAMQGIAGPPGPSGGGSGGGAAPTVYQIAGVASFTANHGLPFVPRVTLVDAGGVEVDTDIHHAPGRTTAIFPGPLTGTLTIG